MGTKLALDCVLLNPAQLYPKKRRRYHDDDEDDYTGSDGYDSASPTPLPPVHIISPFGGAFGLCVAKSPVIIHCPHFCSLNFDF